MNRKLQIYIEGERLELFQDEKITINSSIQNINDISKVFTDLTQSFTVPASPHNNRIFNHFYNSDVDARNNVVLNYNIRKTAWIEIDLTPLRKGSIQLEKANIKNGQPYSYTIVFYGQLTSLKDKFSEDKLSDLDFSDYSHEYIGTEVVDRITGATDYDVRYPLISSERLWQYGSGSQNIGNSSHHINFTELFPALKINRIFDAIQTKYGITIGGNIRLDKRFDNCFLYLKNKDVLNVTTSAVQVDIEFTTSQYFDYTTNEVLMRYIEPESLGLAGTISNFNGNHFVTIDVVPSLPTTYYVDIYYNGQLMGTTTESGNATIDLGTLPNSYGLSQNVSVKFRSAPLSVPMTFTTTYNYVFNYSLLLNGSAYNGSINANSNNSLLTLVSLIDLSALVPEMKVADFVSGIIKEYNLTVIPESETLYKLETVDNWYALGSTYNITEFTDISSIDVERVKLYKKIAFKHLESESFMNRAFKENNLREYGSLDYQFDTDGNDYTIDLPFENLLFSRLANNLQVGYNLTKAPDFKPYIPKPTLLFLNDIATCDTFYINDGTTTSAITSYPSLGQDVISNTTNYSLNFGNDISSFYNVNIPNSMFVTWYFNYLNNLFQRKNRLTYVKTKLPLYILTQLKLNDRLIIRDHRYLINEMKIDLSNGVVDFVLLNDFAQLIPKNYSKNNSGTQLFDVPISFPNGAVNITFDLTNANGATISDTELTNDGVITITAPAYKPKQLKLRVLADGGTFEAQTCLTNTFPATYIIGIKYNYPTYTTIENILITEEW